MGNKAPTVRYPSLSLLVDSYIHQLVDRDTPRESREIAALCAAYYGKHVQHLKEASSPPISLQYGICERPCRCRNECPRLCRSSGGPVHVSYKDGIALTLQNHADTQRPSEWIIDRPLKMKRPSKWLIKKMMKRFSARKLDVKASDYWPCDLSRTKNLYCSGENRGERGCVVFQGNKRIRLEKNVDIKVAKFMDMTHDEYGELILLGGHDGILRCYGLRYPDLPIVSWTAARSNPIRSCAHHRYGVNKTLIVFTTRGGLYAVHFEAESEAQYLAKCVETKHKKADAHSGVGVSCVAISSDGRSLATGADDFRVRLYDISGLKWNNKRSAAQITGNRQHRNRVELVCVCDWPAPSTYVGKSIVAVQFAGNGCVIASGTDWGGPLFYILLHNGEYRSGRLLTTHDHAYNNRITSLSCDDGILVVGNWARQASVHDLRYLMRR